MEDNRANRSSSGIEKLDEYLEAIEDRALVIDREPITRMTFHLTGQATKALERRQKVTAQSGSDVACNALVAYGYLTKASRAGYDVLLNPPDKGKALQIEMRVGTEEEFEAQIPEEPITRMTFHLTGQATASLEQLQEFTGQSGSDVACNALVAYEYLTEASRAGYDVLLYNQKNPDDILRPWMIVGA